MDYKLVSSYDQKEFEQLVLECLKLGYLLAGGVSVTYSEWENRDGFTESNMLFIQAVYKNASR